MSCRASCTPSLSEYMEMSVAVPGRLPVSDRYWTSVIGPNQNRCRGKTGRSSYAMYRSLGLAATLGVVNVPPPQVKSGPYEQAGLPGRWTAPNGDRHTPTTKSMYSRQNRWFGSVILRLE